MGPDGREKESFQDDVDFDWKELNLRCCLLRLVVIKASPILTGVPLGLFGVVDLELIWGMFS